MVLRNYKMKLNLAKCVFSMKTRKFLGFMVSKNGIKSNSDKLKALTKISPPRTFKEVQVLIGRVVALSRFISKMADICLLFFKSLRNITKFVWIKEC